MKNLLLAENIGIELFPVSGPTSDTKFLFESSVSLVASGKILTEGDGTVRSLLSEGIGSEPWFTDNSDFFRFQHSGELHSLILKVPPENALLNNCPPLPQDGYFSIRLTSEEKGFTVPPQIYRNFDPVRRTLHCFTRTTASETVYRIASNLSLIFNDSNVLSGWILYQPLENIADSYLGAYDTDVVDDATYKVFSDYYKIFSDNELEAYDDDLEVLVAKLLSEISSERISRIAGPTRRRLMEEALRDLQDYWGPRDA